MVNLTRHDIRDFAARLSADGYSPSSVRNCIDPLRVICRIAFDDEIISVDPTAKLRLPPSRGRRERSVSPGEAEALIDALPSDLQALWATAIYVGLRRGELQELRWENVDLEQRIGHCVRAWDDEGGCVVTTKSDAGRRSFPLIQRVRRRMIEHKLATGRSGFDLVFGRSAVDRFVPSTVGRRSKDAWLKAGLEPLTFHEGRHSAATLGSYAGIGDLELTHIMGHTSVLVTKDIYGHVRQDQIIAVGRTLDRYLDGESA
jgi:integrase